MELFGVYDRVVGTYGPPVSAVNEADFVRRCRSAYSQNPFSSDLDLFHFGSFDERIGIISVLPAPDFLCSVSSLFVGDPNE